MTITKQTVADKISADLHHKSTLAQLVDWSEKTLMDGEFDEHDALQYFRKSLPASVLLTCVPSAWHGKTAKNFSTSLAILHA